MNGADWTLLAVIGAGGLLGLRRGGITGTLDLIALTIGAAAALFAAPWIDDRLVGIGIEHRWLLVTLAFVVFSSTTGISGLVLRMITTPLGLATKVPPFGLLDSVIGVAPGLAKGAVLAIGAVLVLLIQFPTTAVAERIRASETGGILAEAGSEGFGWAGDLAGVDLSGLTDHRIDPGQIWAGSASLPAGDLDPDQAAESEAFRLVNAARDSAGLEPLERVIELAVVARDHAAAARPGGGGRLPPNAADAGDRLAGAGVRCLATGAVLGAGDSVDSAIAAMLRSPEHRDVLLSGTYFWAGFGVLTGNDGQSIVVGVFTL